MSRNNSFLSVNNKTNKRKSKFNKKAEENDDDKNLNKNIGPYIIINKIKEGINSKLYLGKSRYTNDEVAIKVISKEIIQENLEDLTLVMNHLESLKILKHKNIVSLYEIYESPKYFYIIMEYYPKKNLLEKIILKRRLNENESLVIFIQLLDALVYMHKMNIAHRNIHTEHILFDKNNRPKIIGFNYSTFYEKNKKIDGLFGSLCYTCPEILNNEEYNPELADVWSLGVVLYVMICGYLPFSEENDEANKNLIIEGKVEYPKEISNKLKDLLKHMLEIDTKRRYNFQKIMKHPWVRQLIETKNVFIGGINIFEMNYPVDEKILNIIEHYFKNFDKNEIRKNLIENKYNEGTGLYKLLLGKIIQLNINSVSDMFSNDFIKYIQKNNNKKNENNNFHKKHIEKVNNKITKLEKYIEDYKAKEDNAVKYLLKLENLKNSVRIIKGNKNNLINKNLNSNYNELKNSIIGINNFNDSSNSLFSMKSINNNNEMKCSIIPNADNDIHYISNNEEEKEDSDVDLIKQFKEDQIKLKKEGVIISKDDKIQQLTQSLINKNNLKYPNKIINNKLIKNDTNNSKPYSECSNNMDTTITPDSKKYINHILVKNDNENKIRESILYSLKNTPNFLKKSLRKSHIDQGSKLEGYLKKNHPENIRRTLLRFSLISNISEEDGDDEKIIDDKESIIIEGGNDKDKKDKEENVKKKLKELKYSLTFIDDGEGEEDESIINESSYISRNDTRFISEIKDALKELNNLKKKDREKEKERREKERKEKEKEKEREKKGKEKIENKEREKEKEKEINNNNNIFNLNDYMKMPSLRVNINREIKEKERNVHFSKFNKNNNGIENKNNEHDNDINDNIYTKENVNNFIIKKEGINEEKSTYIAFDGSEFSFHDEESALRKKSSKRLNLFKSLTTDICNYKNDKLIISKLNNLFNNKETLSISNIEKKREKIYLFSFNFDKHKINKINVDNVIINEKFVDTSFKIYYDKKKIQYNRNHKKRESYEIFDNFNEPNINNKNNIAKYTESILNRSNNFQSDPNINSSNNSCTSNNKNSSTLYGNGNNQYILYDNNFIINNDNNEDDDSIFKIIDKNSNKETSLDISSIKKTNINTNNKKDGNEPDSSDLMKKINIFKILSKNAKKQKDYNLTKVYDNKLPKKNKTTKNNFNISTSPIKKYNFFNGKSSTDQLFLSLTDKNRDNKSFLYNKKRKRNRSMENKTKNYIYLRNQKITKNSTSQKKKLNLSIKLERKVKTNVKEKPKKLNNKFIYNSYNNLNLDSFNSLNSITNYTNIKNITPVKLYKKKNARYSSLINDKNLYINTDVSSCKDRSTSYIKTTSYDKYSKKSSKKRYNNNINKNNKIENRSKSKSKSKPKQNTSKKPNKGRTFNRNLLNSNNKTCKSLFLLRQIKDNQNKIKKLTNSKPELIINKTLKKDVNNNIIHKKIQISKNSNKNIENMLLKRKEIVKRIRNYKKILSNLDYSERKHNLTNITDEKLNNFNNIKFKEIKSDNYNYKNSPKVHKKLLSDINILDDNANYSVLNKKINNEDTIKHNSCENSPNRALIKSYNDAIHHKKNIFHNCIIKNNIYENNIKNYFHNTNTNNNNLSHNSSSISQDNIDEKNINRKRYISIDTNNKIACCSNSSIRPASDLNDTFTNLDDITLLVGRGKKVNYNNERNKK